MRVDFMKNFLRVVDLGSLKKASKELGLSISTLSFQISQIERFYGAKLLKRTSNGVKLTEEGKIAYENIKSIVESIVEAKRRIMELNGNKITVASGMVGMNIVFDLKTLIKAKYPDTDVGIVLRGAHDCINGILNGEYTFAIVGDISENNRLVYDVIGKDRLVLITSPNHPLSRRDRVKVEDLKEYPLITLTENYGITTSVLKALRASGYELSDFNVKYVVDDFFTLLNLVSDGEGVSITSLTASSKACEMGLVRAIAIEDLKDERNVYFVTTDVVIKSDRFREIAQFVKEKAKLLFDRFDVCA